MSCECFFRNTAICITAGRVTRKAGPAISIKVQAPVITQPTGPVKSDIVLAKVAFAAKVNPLPNNARLIALAMINVN